MGESNGDGHGKDPVSGRFAAGNTYGGRSPGNPIARRMSVLRRSVVESTTEEQVKAAMDRLYELGLAGDVMALRAWIEFIVGKATQPVEVGAMEGQGTDLAGFTAVVLATLSGHPELRLRIAEALGGREDVAAGGA
jgi:hypothetical protein